MTQSTVAWHVTAVIVALYGLGASACYVTGGAVARRLLGGTRPATAGTILLERRGRLATLPRPVTVAVAVAVPAPAFAAWLVVALVFGLDVLSWAPVLGLLGLAVAETLLARRAGTARGRAATVRQAATSLLAGATAFAAAAHLDAVWFGANDGVVAALAAGASPGSLLAAGLLAGAIRYVTRRADVPARRVWGQTALLCLAAIPLGVGTAGLVGPSSLPNAAVLPAVVWTLAWLGLIAVVNSWIGPAERPDSDGPQGAGDEGFASGPE